MGVIHTARVVLRETLFHHPIEHIARLDVAFVHLNQFSCRSEQPRQYRISTKKKISAIPFFWLYLSINRTIFGRKVMLDRYNS